METPFLSSFRPSGFKSVVRFSPKNLVPEIINWLALVVRNCTAVRHVFLNCVSCLTDIEPSSMLINTECIEFSIYLLICIHVSPAMVEVTMIVSGGDMVKAFWDKFLHSQECSIGKLTET